MLREDTPPDLLGCRPRVGRDRELEPADHVRGRQDPDDALTIDNEHGARASLSHRREHLVGFRVPGHREGLAIDDVTHDGVAVEPERDVDLGAREHPAHPLAFDDEVTYRRRRHLLQRVFEPQ